MILELKLRSIVTAGESPLEPATRHRLLDHTLFDIGQSHRPDQDLAPRIGFSRETPGEESAPRFDALLRMETTLE